MNLLLCNLHELNGEDRLQRQELLYKIIKANLNDTIEIIDMLNVEKYNIFEGESKEIDFSIFS